MLAGAQNLVAQDRQPVQGRKTDPEQVRVRRRALLLDVPVREDNQKGCHDFCTETGSSQGWILARTVLYVPNSIQGQFGSGVALYFWMFIVPVCFGIPLSSEFRQ